MKMKSQQSEPIPLEPDGNFLVGAEPVNGDTFWNRPLSRRSFFSRAAGVVAAFHFTDVAVAESGHWDNNEPVFLQVDTERTPEKHRNHMTVFLPGLGVPGNSAANMVYALKPSVEPYGQLVYLKYADDGLTTVNFQKAATAMKTMFQEKQIEHVTFICHSAGGPNLGRILQAPVEKWGFVGTGIGRPAILEDAWQYWQREAGVTIDHVTYVSSPPSGDYIKGVVQQNVARLLGVMPESVLQAGVSEKLLGNLAISHTVNFDHFEKEWDRINASFRSAGDDYSATDWLTQLHVIQSMSPSRYQGTLSPQTGISVIRPTYAINDRVVLTADLPAAWAAMHGRDPKSVHVMQDPNIGHANIFDRQDEFCRLFAGLYGSLYPPSPADVRMLEHGSRLLDT
jgi:hypothetical protein